MTNSTEETKILASERKRMPFGKYKGIKLVDMVLKYADYVEWLLKNVKHEINDDFILLFRNYQRYMPKHDYKRYTKSVS